MGLLDKMHMGMGPGNTAKKKRSSTDGTPEEHASLLNGQGSRHSSSPAPRKGSANASKSGSSVTVQVCAQQPPSARGNHVVTQLRVNGMSCSACSSAVERALLNVPGVHSASVALLQQSAQVAYDPVCIPKAQTLVHAVEDSGFEATLLSPAAPDSTQVGMHAGCCMGWCG